MSVTTEQFNGQIPSTHKELESLAGVGRKQQMLL